MKKLLMLVSLLLIVLVSVPNTLAYFYTYTVAEGKMTVSLNDSEKFKEEVKEKSKELTITADEDSDPIFVRAKVITTSDVTTTVTKGDGWSGPTGDYYYYAKPIDGKDGDEITDVTTKLTVTIEFPADAKDGDKKNVVVLYEATPALFSEKEPSGTDVTKYKTSDGWWYTDWKEVLVED